MKVVKIRELTLQAPAGRGRPAYLSAASGLAQAGEFLYVIADDELHLGVFPIDGAPGSLLPMFAGELPIEHRERKASKPDWETLTRLPSLPGYPTGALLALASGSKPNRCSGILLPLTANGAPGGTPRIIDLSDVYAALQQRLTTLNIEGAVCIGNELILLQRGNKKTADNACIRLSLGVLLSTDSITDPDLIQVLPMDLGAVNGIPLCFTDGTVLPDGSLIFTAIAEDTANNYDDGPCAGAAIGILDVNGRLSFLERVEPPLKIEGIEAHIDGDTIRLLLVTDADDIRIPALLLSAEIRGYPFTAATYK
jgi:hypothetical protein